jgi:hypothetical protein
LCSAFKVVEKRAHGDARAGEASRAVLYIMRDPAGTAGLHRGIVDLAWIAGVPSSGEDFSDFRLDK